MMMEEEEKEKEEGHVDWRIASLSKRQRKVERREKEEEEEEMEVEKTTTTTMTMVTGLEDGGDSAAMVVAATATTAARDGVGFRNTLLGKPRVCANCKEEFLLHLNSAQACRFHPGYFASDDGYFFWSCCGRSEAAALGCVLNAHVTYDDQLRAASAVGGNRTY